MKHIVSGIIDADHKPLPDQEVDAESFAEAKLLAAAQAGGYWTEDTIVICPERQVYWDFVKRTLEKKNAEIERLQNALKAIWELNLELGQTLRYTRIGWDDTVTCQGVLEPINQISAKMGAANPMGTEYKVQP